MEIKNGAIGNLTVAKLGNKAAQANELVVILLASASETIVYWVHQAKRETIKNESIESFTSTKLTKETRSVLTNVYQNYKQLIPLQSKREELKKELLRLDTDERTINLKEYELVSTLDNITTAKIRKVADVLNSALSSNRNFSIEKRRKDGQDQLLVELTSSTRKYLTEDDYRFLYTEYDGQLMIHNHEDAVKELAPSISTINWERLKKTNTIQLLEMSENAGVEDKNSVQYSMCLLFAFQKGVSWSDVEKDVESLFDIISAIFNEFPS